MTFVVKNAAGAEVEARFDYQMQSYQIGDQEFPVQEMSSLAAHFLLGGMFGWRNGITSPAVNEVLTTLFREYTPQGGEWVRKKIEDGSPATES